MDNSIDNVLNLIEKPLERIKKISSVWVRKDGTGANQRIFTVTLSCDGLPCVNYGPNIQAIADAIYTCPIDKFLDEFKPVLRAD